MKHPPSNRGFLLFDAILGIVILIMLLILLTAAITHTQHAAQLLAARRAALCAADEQLQQAERPTAHAPPPDVQPDARIPAPPGFIWASVDTGDHGGQLWGLVPTDSMPAPAATREGNR